jgi:hypothetical protein
MRSAGQDLSRQCELADSSCSGNLRRFKTAAAEEWFMERMLDPQAAIVLRSLVMVLRCHMVLRNRNLEFPANPEAGHAYTGWIS